MAYKHNINMTDIYDMMPYERDIFVELTVEDLENKLTE